MSKGEMLRALVKQRITAAAEEIFALFERTIAEYEEELCRSKEKNQRQEKLLEAVYNPPPQLHRADVRQLLVHTEEVPSEQQGWSSSLHHEDLKTAQIKEEEKEPWICQQGEQLTGLEEADPTNFPSTPAPVKSEEEPEFSQLHQGQTEADVENWDGQEPARNFDADSHLQSDTEDKPFSRPETDANGDCNETGEPQSGCKSLKKDDIPVSDSRCRTGEKPFSCSDCGKTFKAKAALIIHIRSHTGERPFSCFVCGRRFLQKPHLNSHMMTHTGEKSFSCTVCKKSFSKRDGLQSHIRIHTGEKPYGCSVFGKSFTVRGNLTLHMRVHTGEKPYSCSVCKKCFSQSRSVRLHMKTHAGEKHPYRRRTT